MANQITNSKAELKLQAECYQWFHSMFLKYPHWKGRFRRVKNETDLSGRAGMIMGQVNKATGIVAGTWDSFFIVEHICWIEFKSEHGILSKPQEDFQELGYAAGWRFRVIKDLVTFKRTTYELLREEND